MAFRNSAAKPSNNSLDWSLEALPSYLRSSATGRGQFAAGLKNHLFTLSYRHLGELLLKSVLFYVTVKIFTYFFSFTVQSN